MPESRPETIERADYGLDAPGVVRTLSILGIIAVVLGIAAGHGSLGIPARLALSIGSALVWAGWAMIASSLLMILSSRHGKVRARDAMLDRLGFTGNEIVVDIGCGHGLMLIGAAKRIPNGKAIGIDLWSQVDQKSNSAAATLANAKAEGVSDRVEVRDGDMRDLPLDSGSVDIVVSSLAIHNVPTSEDRRKAIREIVRVLKPGGRVGIIDIAHVGGYARAFREAGMSDVSLHGFTPWIYPPTRVLTAIK
jgi:ubiquinone/menaquinone biosynthesis C-methylase UbiE